MSDENSSEPGRFPRRTVRRQNTRARILSAASKLFRSVGYGASTVHAIAEAADVHITTLFTHFKSKQELAASLNDASIERLQQFIHEAQGKVPFFKFFRTLVSGTARTLEASADPSLSLWHSLERDPELSLAWAEYERRQVELLAGYIAADHGLERHEYAPQLAASILVSSSWISHRQWSQNPQRGTLEGETLAALEIAEAMARTALRKGTSAARKSA